MLLLTAEFTMREGCEEGALALIATAKEQAEAHQPGTLVYLVHRILDADGNPGRTLFFYEGYEDAEALTTHLDSSSWKAIEEKWTEYFEGPSWHSITSQKLDRIAAFARPGVIPIAAKAG